MPAHLKLSIQIPTLNIFELRQRFRKSMEYLWRYRIFAGTLHKLKVVNFQNVFDAQNFHLAIARAKYLPTWNFPRKCPPSASSIWGEEFENRLNTFGDIGFLLAYCTGWNRQNFKCCRRANFSPCHRKSIISAHLKHSTQMTTLNIFELRQRFRKSVEYLWRYRIFAGTVYKLKVAKFQMLSMSKVFTLTFQNKIPAHLKLYTQMPTLKIFEPRQRFQKSVEYPWRCRIFCWRSVQVESGKKSNVVDVQSFHVGIPKVKYLRTWNFTPNCPPSTS